MRQLVFYSGVPQAHSLRQDFWKNKYFCGDRAAGFIFVLANFLVKDYRTKTKAIRWLCNSEY
ncbi:MAG: hypothetical protein WCS30_10435 [Selenomonadaceae bacterium]